MRITIYCNALCKPEVTKKNMYCSSACSTDMLSMAVATHSNPLLAGGDRGSGAAGQCPQLHLLPAPRLRHTGRPAWLLQELLCSAVSCVEVSIITAKITAGDVLGGSCLWHWLPGASK